MFLNSCPVFLALVICVGLLWGRAFCWCSISGAAQHSGASEAQRRKAGDITAEAWTLCSTAFSKLMLSLDFNLLVIVMQIALICRGFYRFLGGSVTWFLKIE